MIRKGLNLSILEKYTARINGMFPLKKAKEHHDRYLKIYKILEEVSDKSAEKGERELANKIREAITHQENLL